MNRFIVPRIQGAAGLTTDRNGNKRERILEAAVVEIAQHGYYQTTIAMIARRAGVADGTIYLYFKNKEELLASIFDSAIANFIKEGKRQLPQDITAEEKLRRIVGLHLSLVGEDQDLAVILQVELRHSLHFMAQLSRNALRGYLDILGEVVQQGQLEGSFKAQTDPALAAKAIFGILDEMSLDWVLSKRNTRLAAKADELANLLLHGLLA